MPHDESRLINSRNLMEEYGQAIARLADGSTFDAYQIIRLLGRGGMGAVYEARHITLGTKYAIKVLPFEFMARPDALERFENEARVMANLDHPNIVKVDDFRKSSGLYWLRMELALGDGGGAVSLQDLADRQNGVLDQSLLLELMDDVLSGIAYAHSKGVIHRDLKPANILLFPKACGGVTAKVSDYGLVKMLGEEFLRSRVTRSVRMSMGDDKPKEKERTSTRALLGTWEYMSPEQKKAGSVNAQSDVYSLGLICYHLLTGRAVSMKTPSQIKPELVTEWDVFLDIAIEENLGERYKDSGEMRSKLVPVRNAIVKKVEQRVQHQDRLKKLKQAAIQLEESGRYESAIEEWKRIRELEPAGTDTDIALERLKRRKEEKEDKEWWEREEKIRKLKDAARKYEAADQFEKSVELWGVLQKAAPDETEAGPALERLKKQIHEREEKKRIVELERRQIEEQERKARETKEAETRRVKEVEYARKREEIESQQAKQRLRQQEDENRYKIESEAKKRKLYLFVLGIVGVVIAIFLIYQIYQQSTEQTSRSGYSIYPTMKPTQQALVESTRMPKPAETPRPTVTSTQTPEIEPTITLKPKVPTGYVYIKPGTFSMGSPSSESNRDSDEVQHSVTLSRGFWMKETEVTQGEWELVMGNNPSNFKGLSRPVEQVSWTECLEYCNKLSVRDGLDLCYEAGMWNRNANGYRLPTEAEWEYGCRAGTTGAYAGSLEEMGWYDKNSGSQSHDVKQKKANAWGLYDMHGNVWEWCWDWHEDYPSGSVTDPSGSSSSSYRVNRGGSWFGGARICRSANRSYNTPGYRYDYLGFRPVRFSD